MSELYDIGKLWQDWETVRLIGEGSFGKVYEIARNRFGIEEHCALKVITIPDSKAEVQSLKNDGMDDQSVTAYYRGLVEEVVQEIALMKKLRNNNNIVRYEDFCVVEHEDSFGWDIVIRMELLKASPVYFKEISLTVSEVLKLGIDMCKALEDCETHKIIHRDIKPDNIFVSENGTYKLGDFGVARTIDKTMAGLSKKGTYTFMAPEVYKGEKYGIDVDIYSLGIVMYKLLNNNREPFLPPFPRTIQYSDKSDALVYRMNGRDIPPIAGLDDRLNSVILKACAFKSEDRYHSASQLKAKLQTILETLKEHEEINTPEDTTETKSEKTVSVFDVGRFKTTAKDAEGESPVSGQKESEKNSSSEKNDDKSVQKIIGVKIKTDDKNTNAKIDEKKPEQIKTDKIENASVETTSEHKKPKWWVVLVAVLGVVAAVAVVIIILGNKGDNNKSETLDIPEYSTENSSTHATVVPTTNKKDETTAATESEHSNTVADVTENVVDEEDTPAKEITVSFDANGGWIGSGSNSGRTLHLNDKYGELPIPEREGYTFEGWYTSANGGTRVKSSTKVTNTSSHTLYAQWSKIAVCTINYDGQSADFAVGTTITYEVYLNNVQETVVGLQGKVNYDQSVLKVKSFSLPLVHDAMSNTELHNEILFLGTSVNGYDFSNSDGNLLVAEFEVISEGSTNIDTILEYFYDYNIDELSYDLISTVY